MVALPFQRWLMFETVLFCLGAYLLGAVPFGLLLSRMAGGADPRDLGSGNIGAANVFRSIHPLLGLLTLVCDGAKGWLPAWGATQAALSPWAVACAGLAAFLGHLFPPYLGFRGGKGVATGAGVFLALVPLALIGSLMAFLCGALSTRYVSVGSMLAALCLPAMVYWIMGVHPFAGLAALCALGVLWRHRENISSLRKGTERPWRR